MEKEVPGKVYFRIGEVSKILDVEPYVLRFWEKEFDIIKPIKSRKGHRLYRRKDIENLLQIKRLLYEDKFTIDGAKRKLKELMNQERRQLKLQLEEKRQKKILIEIKRRLEELRDKLV